MYTLHLLHKFCFYPGACLQGYSVWLRVHLYNNVRWDFLGHYKFNKG